VLFRTGSRFDEPPAWPRTLFRKVGPPIPLLTVHPWTTRDALSSSETAATRKLLSHVSDLSAGEEWIVLTSKHFVGNLPRTFDRIGHRSQTTNASAERVDQALRVSQFRDVASYHLESLLVAILASLLRRKLLTETSTTKPDLFQTFVVELTPQREAVPRERVRFSRKKVRKQLRHLEPATHRDVSRPTGAYPTK
jgi:hypothetical protein